MASTKIRSLERIRNRLNLSQAKNSFIMSQFSYRCLVWVFCSKTLQNKINQCQKTTLRRVYNEPNLNLDKLVELDKSTTIHIKNISLLTEVYKTTRGENPIFTNKIFTQKKQYNHLPITNLLNFLYVRLEIRYKHLFSVLPIFGIKFQTLSKMNQTQNA